MSTVQTAPTWTQWIESGDWKAARTAVPMLPPTIGHVMSLALDPDVSVSQLTRVVSRDQVLATRVLRLANSAYCGPLEEITTINQAMVRIGTAAVRNVVLAVCLSSRIAEAQVYGAQGRDLLNHSIGTACLAQMVAARVRADSDEAFLCGLLHDIGKLLVLKLANDFAKGHRRAPSHEEVAAVMSVHHGDMGAHLLRNWHLPLVLVEAVQFHHAPAAAATFSKQAWLTGVANRLSHRYGFGCTADPSMIILDDPGAAAAGLDEAWLAELDLTAPAQFLTAHAVMG